MTLAATAQTRGRGLKITMGQQRRWQNSASLLHQNCCFYEASGCDACCSGVCWRFIASFNKYEREHREIALLT